MELLISSGGEGGGAKRSITLVILHWFFFCFIATSCSDARTTYYISAAGNDANNGTSRSTPWRTPNKIYTRNASLPFIAGDSILFRRGDSFEGQFRVTLSGSPGSPIVIGAYGVGNNPIIYGDFRNRTWEAIPGKPGVYKSFTDTQSFITSTSVYQWVNGEWRTFGSNPQGERGTNPAEWPGWLDALAEGQIGVNYGTDTIWVHLWGNITMPASRDSFRVARTPIFILDNSHDVLIRDLDIRYGEGPIWVENSSNIIVRSVSSLGQVSGGIYLKRCFESLVDSCALDSVANAVLYMNECTRCVFRANTISNLTLVVDGITVTGDKCGIGIQGSAENSPNYSVGWNTAEYNTLTNIYNAFVDFYWNYCDTIRYNTGIGARAGMSAHGTNLVLSSNDLTGFPGNFNGGNNFNSGSGSLTIEHNTYRNVSDYGLWLAADPDSSGTINVNGNVIVADDPWNTFIWHKTAGITSMNNTFAGFGSWRSGSDGTTYSALDAFQAATGNERGSVYVEDFPVQVDKDVVQRLRLVTNYPNPFNPTTTIEYMMPVDGYASLKVFDSLGREVVTLVQGVQVAGTHRVVWNAEGMASGVYIYRFTSGSYTETRRMLLIR